MADVLPELTGRVALVTGAGSGIGAAVARRLARHGAVVAAAGLTESSAAETAAGLEGAHAFGADVSDADQVARLFAEVRERLGPPAVVVHAAGVDDQQAKDLVQRQVSAGETVDVVAGLEDDAWRRMIAVNLDGSFWVLRQALRGMRETGGSVVLIGSEAAVHGLAGLGHYAASKGGVHALVRSAAKEAAAYGVRVNGIAPGVIDTPMSRRSHGLFGGSAVVAPIGRAGDPDEIAKVALFLSSDLASYVVGEVVHVDGGRMAS